MACAYTAPLARAYMVCVDILRTTIPRVYTR